MIEAKRKEYLNQVEKNEKIVLDEAAISLLKRFQQMRNDRRRRVMSCGMRGRPRKSIQNAR